MVGRHEGALVSRKISELPGGLGRNANESLMPGESVLAEVLTVMGEAAVLTDKRLLLVRGGFRAGAFGKVLAFDYSEVQGISTKAKQGFDELRVVSSLPAPYQAGLMVWNERSRIEQIETFARTVRKRLNLPEPLPEVETPPPVVIRSKLPGKLGETVNVTLKDDEVVLDEIAGAEDGMVVTNRRLLIVKVGFAAQALHGHKIKSYPFDVITSVEVSSGALIGRIQITVPGSSEGAGRNSWSNPTSQNENLVQIGQHQLPEARRIANLIEEKMAEARRPAAVAVSPSALPTSVADELLKLAGLRDAGVLTEEEFSAAKARLLQS